MFRRLPDPARRIPFDFEGESFEARAGDSVAAALLANAVFVFRSTPVTVIGDQNVVGYSPPKLEAALKAAGA